MSVSLPFAVSMMIGTWLRERSWRQTSTPVQLGQHQVEDDQVEAAFVEALQRFAAVEGRGDVVAVLAQRVAEQGLDRLLVVDEQDAGGPVGHAYKGSRAAQLGHMCEYQELRIWVAEPI